jgi:hypothetical protein
MTMSQIDVKPLQPIHLEDAKLFSDRYELMRFIFGIQRENGIKNPNIVEIGVALGDFSRFLIEEAQPNTFAAVDLFDLHQTETIWGMSTKDLFKGGSQIDFYKSKIASFYEGDLVIEQGFSAEATLRLQDNFYDIVYIDAGHDYENVKKDALAGLQKIRRGGFMIFNDYTMMDHLYGTPYGVVPAANELIHDTGRMKVVGMGLNSQMFCDLAVRVL